MIHGWTKRGVMGALCVCLDQTRPRPKSRVTQADWKNTQGPGDLGSKMQLGECEGVEVWAGQDSGWTGTCSRHQGMRPVDGISGSRVDAVCQLPLLSLPGRAKLANRGRMAVCRVAE